MKPPIADTHFHSAEPFRQAVPLALRGSLPGPRPDLDDLLDAVGEVAVLADHDWVIRYVNDAYLRQTGMTREQVLGRRPFEYQPLFNRTVFYESIEICHRERRPMEMLGYSMMLGRCVLVRVFPVAGGTLLLANDAAPEIVAEFQLAQRALDDPLTGLPNRLALNQDVQQATASSAKVSLVLIGVSRIRAIHLTQGTVTEGMAMIELASRLRLVTEPDERLYRLHWDEFALLTPCRGEAAVARTHRMLDETRRPISIRYQLYDLSAAAGLVEGPEHGEDAETLLHHAMVARRHAQRQGSGRYALYAPQLQAELSARIELEREVREALAAGTFTLALQPKASTHAGEVVGAEALVRWTHPQRGPLSPGVFLPILEEYGLMRELDLFVLRRALETLLRLSSLGLAVPVSINISVDSLADESFTDKVRLALAETGVAPELLEIEIPEGSLMRDVGVSTRVLAALSKLGVGISVDDFGTGYSSFAYLARFPVQALKIDRSLINAMTNEQSIKVVSGLVRLAHSLSLRVVAEGAETEEQMALLKRMRCDEVQGFVYARPMPFDDFHAFALAHRAPPSAGISPFSV